jgi:hypothetical protein
LRQFAGTTSQGQYDEFIHVDDPRFDDFARHVLRCEFGKEEFRENQLEIIKSILEVVTLCEIFEYVFIRAKIILGYWGQGTERV